MRFLKKRKLQIFRGAFQSGSLCGREAKGNIVPGNFQVQVINNKLKNNQFIDAQELQNKLELMNSGELLPHDEL